MLRLDPEAEHWWWRWWWLRINDARSLWIQGWVESGGIRWNREGRKEFDLRFIGFFFFFVFSRSTMFRI